MNAPDPFTAPWHQASYNRFLNDTLPTLLAAHLPLASYTVMPTGESSCRISFLVTPPDARPGIEIAYEGVPAISQEGTFLLESPREGPKEARCVVPPVASSEDLETAEVRCVGEHLEAEFRAHLMTLPMDLLSLLTLRTDPVPDEERTPTEIRTRTNLVHISWEPTGIAAALRSWLPLTDWFRDFFAGEAVMNRGEWRTPRAQTVDPTNWLAGRTHLRRILVDGDVVGFHPGQIGRACFIETPEGPNVGRVLTLARGAVIENGRVVSRDTRPQALLGISASCIPLFEHSSDARLLMGANMMRQWHTPPYGENEPALVQTGLEPPVDVAPTFWCGRNLLTAFVSVGVDTHEDAILLSASAADRLNFPYRVESGDKLSNRHGAKGVVSRIAPDDEMPHLPDGTPVEIVYSFTSLPSRLNHGQVQEAVLGRIASAEGRPVISPPFEGPAEEEIKRRLSAAGISPSGMETLRTGKNGPLMERHSTVGWVYWGRTMHDAAEKLSVTGDDPTPRGQLLTRADYRILREAGAFHTIHSLFNLQAQGGVRRIESLIERLQAIGIALAYEGGRVVSSLSEVAQESLTLAEAVSHPCLPGIRVSRIGVREGDPGFERVRKANSRLERLYSARAALPDSLRREAIAALEKAVAEYMEDLVGPADLVMQERAGYSGRAVLAPGTDLSIEQIGLPGEMAWKLFGPLLVRDGEASEAEIAARTREAANALDARLARSYVLANRKPSLLPTSLLALRPVRLPAGESVLRIHPFHCPLLDVDFDGDQLAVFLPITPEAQRELAERLSPKARLAADPELARVTRMHAALWGLAAHSLTPNGKAEIEEIIGVPLRLPMGILDKTALDTALVTLCRLHGAQRTLEAVEALYRRGFELVKTSGASFAPFPGEGVQEGLPPAPLEDDAPAAEWDVYRDGVTDLLTARAARLEFGDDDLGPILLAILSGARGTFRLLTRYIACAGSVDGSHSGVVSGKDLFFDIPDCIRHSLRVGLTPPEAVAAMAGYRRALKQINREYEAVEERERPAGSPVANPAAEGSHLLGRALRSVDPGRVFARAAQAGETDPLTGIDSRLFMGLPPA